MSDLKVIILSTNSYGEIRVSINGKRYLYYADSAMFPHLERLERKKKYQDMIDILKRYNYVKESKAKEILQIMKIEEN